MNKPKLHVVVNEELQDFSAHDMKVNTVAKTENYHVMLLEGFSNYNYNSESSRNSSTQKQHKEAIPVIKDGKLEIRSADHSVLYYTAELSSILPVGWETKAAKLSNYFAYDFGLTVFHPDHADEVKDVRALSVEDFREQGAPQCDVTRPADRMFEEPAIPCEREENHLGEHQSIHDGKFHAWTPGGGSSRTPPYGFKSACRYCGSVSSGDATGERVCFSCDFWLEQHARGGKRFVIDGRHYRPGEGGFGGAVFTINRKDGTKWEGELFTQGEIPEQFLDMFPDNAEWAAESKAKL